MQEFKIKTNSWHYKWLSWYRFTRDVFEPAGWNSDVRAIADGEVKVTDYHHNNYSRITNFCQYWRCVLLWPLLRFAFNIVPYFIVLYAITTFGLLGFAIGGIGITSVIILLALIGGCAVAFGFLMSKTSDAITAVEKTEFVGAIISTYKDKFCPLVTYESKNDE